MAYSAGRDSTALLHAAARVARELGAEVIALHVHHGLMPQADAWLEFAQEQVERLRKAGLPVRLVSTRLTGKPAKGDSIEAWARRERRAALARMAHDEGAAAVLLAQHRRDQAETVLLQALRGAGPAGLAAMPRAAQHEGLWWLRPWLEQPREAIEAYVREHRLHYVDDASNADRRLARGRLREGVWGALTQAFGDAEVALAGVARRAQQAQALLSEVASNDLAAIVDEQGRLAIAPWRELSAARRVNALRAWLRAALGRGAPESLLDRLMVELPRARQARWPADGGRELALYRGKLTVLPAGTRRDQGPPGEQILDLSRPGRHALPAWRGTLEVTRGADGAPAALLVSCRLIARQGGERWQAQPRSTPRSLKKQYQAAAIAPMQREGPLVYAGDRLVFVPGLGLDARVRVARRSGTLWLRWRPDDPSPPGR